MNLLQVGKNHLASLSTSRLAARARVDIDRYAEAEALFQQAQEHRSKGNHEEEITFKLRGYEVCPEHTELNHHVACFYYQGVGVKRDYEKARACYLKAASQGHSVAAYQMGFFCDRGIGGCQDRTEAMQWYKTAAQAGIKYAQYGLGVGYLCGMGVDKNQEEAGYWLAKAVEQGHSDAKFALASLYIFGKVENADGNRGPCLMIAALEGGSKLAIRFRDGEAIETIFTYNSMSRC